MSASDTPNINWSGRQVRETFLSFFEEAGHRRVRSSSLVPANDPTLLFTNAGMNQFKDVFLGIEKRDYNRATTCQKCVRAGGKHNDLENVGYTKRHHTFFEMLGNFSFGDYFKKQAIGYAWELVTSPRWYGLPKDKLYATIFKGEGGVPRDAEAYDEWLAQGVSAERIFELGASENFWAMGDTGPCGPCSEIHYDMGPEASDEGHADCKFPCDCGRYVEIWNLVFMQFNRDASGTLVPLPKPSVDTGAGLERLAAVLQGKISNFDTDLFIPLIHRAGQLTGTHYGAGDKSDASLRIIADHSRAATFLISDGVMPSNDGRGYVLRKIIRRALRHANSLRPDDRENILPEMADAVRKDMQSAYPELIEHIGRVKEILAQEEERFARTVTIGLKKFQDFTAQNRAEREAPTTPEGIPATRSGAGAPPVLSGEQAFMLYDTYGLPKDFIEEVARESGVSVAWPGFDTAMQEQRSRARASWKGGGSKQSANPAYSKLVDTFTTEPDFYYGTVAKDCHIEAIVGKNGPVNELKPGEEGEVVLDRTSIYAESGGQVADRGLFLDDSGATEVAEVRGAYYPVSKLIAHRVLAKEGLQVGDRITTTADAQRRARDMRNHTATHLMHAALRNILGTHVKQEGSLVAPDRLRFDFSHYAAVDASELREIEQQVNEEIVKNECINTDLMNLEDALASGALAFFGDRYPDKHVRVVTIVDKDRPRGFYSKELCGGTHVMRSGEIGLFKIVGEQSAAAGIRRIEAITGDHSLSEFRASLDTLRKIGSMLNAGQDEVLAAVERQTQTVKQLEKQLEELRRKSTGSLVDSLMANVKVIKGVNVLAAAIPSATRESLRQLADSLRQKMGSGAVILGSSMDGKVALIAAVTKDLAGRVHAGKIIQELAPKVGGSGGGRPDLAEAGGKDTSALESTIAGAPELLERVIIS